MRSRYIKIPYTPTITALQNKQQKDNSDLRKELVRYALQYEGNPYQYGGNSLTKGTDCSGFIQAVFKAKGILLPRTSRLQSKCGRRISFHALLPGDLIFYRKNGRVNHVALYIGDEKVIHASNPKSGIKVSDYYYRKPYAAVNCIDS